MIIKKDTKLWGIDAEYIDLPFRLRGPNNKTVATTNGVFDLLHVGHVRFLQSIKKIADVLVVCVNGDESVRRLKGEGRPIVPLDERMEILNALRCVDYVISFDEDTPCEILAKIKPKIHVKDWSYSTKDLPEQDIVENNGGIVVIMPRLEGHSTTDMINNVLYSEELTKSFGKVGKNELVGKIKPER